MTKRRTQIEVLHDMLLAIQKNGGSIKTTQLMYKSNLSYKLLKEYIEVLKKKELASRVSQNNSVEYIITKNGEQFLREYRKILEFNRMFGF